MRVLLLVLMLSFCGAVSAQRAPNRDFQRPCNWNLNLREVGRDLLRSGYPFSIEQLARIAPVGVSGEVKRAHAQQQKPAAIVPPPAPVAAPIPVPEPEAGQLKAAVEEYQKKLAALSAEYDPQFKWILARAAQRAKMTPEESDRLTVKPVMDAKGGIIGFTWIAPDPPKTETKPNN